MSINNTDPEQYVDKYFPVLDHGFVSLVDYMGSDERIERFARVSYGKGTRTKRETRGLIRYLIRNLHTSPLESVELTFHCAMPVFVARQWVRHRTACLAGDVPLHFDLPGGIERRGYQLYKKTVRDIYEAWHNGAKPIPNRWTGEDQRIPQRDRIKEMHLRSINEDTGEQYWTRVKDIWSNGEKLVYRIEFNDGSVLRATKDHLCLTDRGWLKLSEALDQEARFASFGKKPATPQENAQDRIRHGNSQRLSCIWVSPLSIQEDGIEETFDLEVEGPYHNFVAGGVVVHNSLNEYSGRYSVMPEAYYTPSPDRYGVQSKSNRQGTGDEEPDFPYSTFAGDIKRQTKKLFDYYNKYLRGDVARELARVNLPLNIYTEWYWKMDLHNLFHFLSLRLDPHAQWEIRQYARVMAGLAYAVAPLATEAFIDYNLNSYQLSNAEIEALRDICAGGRVNESELSENGMSNREIEEFKDIMFGERYASSVDDFILDPETSLSPEQAHTRLHGES